MAATGVTAKVAGYLSKGRYVFFYLLFYLFYNKYLHIDYMYKEQQLTVTCFDNDGYQHDDNDEGQREDKKSDENAQETSCGMFFFSFLIFFIFILLTSFLDTMHSLSDNHHLFS